MHDAISCQIVAFCSEPGGQERFQCSGAAVFGNGVSEIFAGRKSILKLTGRKEMAEAFVNFLKNFDTVYHFNGQQVVTIDGEH